MDDLKVRLRDTRKRTPFEPWARETMLEAGDRIEALEQKVKACRSHLQIVPMLLGPKAWELWRDWIDDQWLPTMLYQHYSWGPKAAPGDGEAIAQILLNVRDDIASGKCEPLNFDDASCD